MTGKAYYEMMRQLAVHHADIRHNDATPHYFRKELDEFYMGLRNNVNFPALIVEGFNLYYDTSPILQRKRRESSFIVVMNYDDDTDYEQIDDAFDYCEHIGDELLRKIITQTEEATCAFTVDDISAVQVQNETDRYVGIRYTLTYSSPFDTDADNDKWI